MTEVELLGPKALGKWLKEWRKATGLTRNELAEKLTPIFDKPAIKAVEHGKASMGAVQFYLKSARPIFAGYKNVRASNYRRHIHYALAARKSFLALGSGR
jgi:hypothetical protein